MSDPPRSSGTACTGEQEYEHDFAQYEICRKCGRTEAAIHGCHHCGDQGNAENGRCWWCLRPTAADAQAETLRAERDEAMKVLAPNMPESGLVDACKQVKQAAISEADNSSKAEAEVARLQAELHDCTLAWSAAADDLAIISREREALIQLEKLWRAKAESLRDTVRSWMSSDQCNAIMAEAGRFVARADELAAVLAPTPPKEQP